MLLDIILFLIIFIASFIGFTRGLLKEVFLFIGFIVSIVFTYVKHDLVVVLFDLEPSLITKIVSTATVYTVSLVVCIIGNTILMTVLKPIRCGVFDRIFGTCIGFLKGAVVAYILIVVIKLFFHTFFPIRDVNTGDIVFPEWFNSSRSYQISTMFLDKIVYTIAPDNFNLDLESIGKKIVTSLEANSKKKMSTAVNENNYDDEKKDKKGMKK